VHDVKLVGFVAFSVTAYPIIPLASSFAFIVIVFVSAVVSVIIGFSLSIFLLL